MIKIFNIIFKYSSPKDFYLIILFLFFSTIFQYFLYILMPIIALNIATSSIQSTSFGKNIVDLNRFFQNFNIEFNLEMILYAALILSLLANLFSLIFVKKLAYFSLRLSSKIQISLFENFLFKKYNYFLKHTKNDSLNNIITDMFRMPNGIFIPFFNFFSSSILAFILIVTLFFINFKVSFALLTILTIAYVKIFKYFKKKLYKTSLDISYSQKKIYDIVSYSLGLNKDLKLYTLEKFISKKFSLMSEILTKTRSFSNFVIASPRYMIEFIIIFFSISAILIIFKNNQFGDETVLFLFFFGILSIKIIPLLQSIYNSIATIQSNKSLIDNLPEAMLIKDDKKKTINHFYNDIQLKNINFKYENKKPILQNLNLKINKGESIAVIGANGVGKSTFINILSGLVKPSSGKIYCDNILVLDKNLYGLFSVLDANPIFLNSNIYENICFKENILKNDKKEIQKILKLVELSHKNLKKYNTDNIEAKFSQGEKQKLALARFLYFKKEFLIIDEGTTNLGSDLELRLLKKIKKIYPKLTIVFISHRFTNLNFFNKVFLLKNKKLFNFKKNKISFFAKKYSKKNGKYFNDNLYNF